MFSLLWYETEKCSKSSHLRSWNMGISSTRMSNPTRINKWTWKARFLTNPLVLWISANSELVLDTRSRPRRRRKCGTLWNITDCWQIAASSSDLINQAMEHAHILPLNLNLIFSIFVWIWFSYLFCQMCFNVFCSLQCVWTCTSSGEKHLLWCDYFFFLLFLLLFSLSCLSSGPFLEVGKSRVVEWIWLQQTSVDY